MSNDLKEFAELVDSKKIYCQVFVPRFALEDFKNGEYSGWYVCHPSASQLEDAVLENLHDTWVETENDTYDVEAFMAWLSDTNRDGWRGHIVLHTAQQGIGVMPIE